MEEKKQRRCLDGIGRVHECDFRRSRSTEPCDAFELPLGAPDSVEDRNV